MSALWTSHDAVAATLGVASRPFDIGGLSIDTRTLKPGDLFIALQGEARDGHEFVGAAFAAGATAALIQHDVDAPPGAALLRVANTQRALEDLGRAGRERSHARIVAITGSVGKTTAKEMMRLMLGALGPTHASPASYNNQWGAPLSLASMRPDCAYGIFEVGMNHFGEIRTLVGFVRPHVALITTIAPAHLEFFGSCEAIADAKSEIFEGILPGGTAILPGESPYAERLSLRARQAHVSNVLFFGDASRSSAKIVSLEHAGEAMNIRADIAGRMVQFRLGAAGAHNAANAVGALLAVAALDGDVLNAAAALSEFHALKGRGERFDVRLENGTARVIDESYNANPVSMRAALANLAHAPARRRLAMLGDMRELGPESPALHRELADAVEAAKADLVFLCGPHMAGLWETIPPSRRGAWRETSADIAPILAAALEDGDVVLVKGSLGTRMAVIIAALKARGN